MTFNPKSQNTRFYFSKAFLSFFNFIASHLHRKTKTLSHGLLPAPSPPFYYSGAVAITIVLCFRTLSHMINPVFFHIHLTLFFEP
jgi:hypothetical protein